jgi:hypothetical protein
MRLRMHTLRFGRNGLLAISLVLFLLYFEPSVASKFFILFFSIKFIPHLGHFRVYQVTSGCMGRVYVLVHFFLYFNVVCICIIWTYPYFINFQSFCVIAFFIIHHIHHFRLSIDLHIFQTSHRSICFECFHHFSHHSFHPSAGLPFIIFHHIFIVIIIFPFYYCSSLASLSLDMYRYC